MPNESLMQECRTCVYRGNPTGDGYLECLRFPPQAVAGNAITPAQPPKVFASGWCGEWSSVLPVQQPQHVKPKRTSKKKGADDGASGTAAKQD